MTSVRIASIPTTTATAAGCSVISLDLSMTLSRELNAAVVADCMTSASVGSGLICVRAMARRYLDQIVCEICRGSPSIYKILHVETQPNVIHVIGRQFITCKYEC